MKKIILLLLGVSISSYLLAQNNPITFDPGGSAGGDLFGIKATENGNNTTMLHFYRNFTFDTQDIDRLVIDAGGKVGIGTSSIGSKLHIYNGSSGITPHSFSDLAVEDDDNGMISILTPNNKTAYYGFADNDDKYVGGMQYEHSNDRMVFRVNNHTADLVIGSSGNLGIGTTNTPSRLSINSTETKFISLTRSGNSKRAHIGYGTNNEGGIYLGTDDNQYTLWVQQNGFVGIGTYDPKSKLSVNGQIRATEVKVLADISVPDYVFEPDYELRTLKETKEYIQENKHLPEIPSAKEIGENGIDIGDMNMRLLKKIEELTLYQIELLERIEELEKKVEKD